MFPEEIFGGTHYVALGHVRLVRCEGALLQDPLSVRRLRGGEKEEREMELEIVTGEEKMWVLLRGRGKREWRGGVVKALRSLSNDGNAIKWRKLGTANTMDLDSISFDQRSLYVVHSQWEGISVREAMRGRGQIILLRLRFNSCK